jgi:putative Ca2+/H+ antiporter (TMEM165/GDT1 family)
VLVGQRIARWLPVTWVHRAAALLFVGLGMATLLGAARSFGL